MSKKQLTKCHPDDEILDGVLGGLADYYGLDAFWLRMIFIALLASEIPVGLMYIAAMFIMKDHPED